MKSTNRGLMLQEIILALDGGRANRSEPWFQANSRKQGIVIHCGIRTIMLLNRAAKHSERGILLAAKGVPACLVVLRFRINRSHVDVVVISYKWGNPGCRLFFDAGLQQFASGVFRIGHGSQHLCEPVLSQKSV